MAFQILKDILTSAPALAMPTETDLFRVETDRSAMGLGAVLSQKQNDLWHLISFISRSLGDAECNYHAADLEMTAVIFALKEWQHCLLDIHVPFEILIDHKNTSENLKICQENKHDGTNECNNFTSNSSTDQEKQIQLILCPGGQTLKRG